MRASHVIILLFGFRDFIKNALVQKINYKNAHSLKFIKTALLYNFFTTLPVPIYIYRKRKQAGLSLTSSKIDKSRLLIWRQ
jgi:hypothetical protein